MVHRFIVLKYSAFNNSIEQTFFVSDMKYRKMRLDLSVALSQLVVTCALPIVPIQIVFMAISKNLSRDTLSIFVNIFCMVMGYSEF